MTATMSEIGTTFRLTEEGAAIVSKIKELLDLPYADEYLSHKDACARFTRELTLGICHDPQGHFVRIYAGIAHSQQFSIPYTKVLEKGVTMRELRKRAYAMSEIADIINSLRDHRGVGYRELFTQKSPNA